MSEAVKLLEKMSQIVNLNEMATAATIGSRKYIVYSDHIPPHFHLMENKKTLCKVIINETMPETTDDILIMKADLNIPVTNKLKKQLLSDLKSTDDEGDTVYKNIRKFWNGMNENNKVNSYDYSSITDYIV